MAEHDASGRPAVALLTLGCSKNMVDSERIASFLEAAGARVVHDAGRADAVIVNTCGFIQSAKEESIEAILDVAELREQGRVRALIVTGCLSQRYGNDLRDSMPEVDVLLGIDPEGAARAALEALGESAQVDAAGVFGRSARLTPRAWSYLRISYGCDNRCAYCAIPLIRGPLRSRPPEEVLAEAQRLVQDGARELNVIGQDTASYGLDVTGRSMVHELLRDLCRIDDLRWLRLLYVHPAHLHDELLEVMASEEKICPYVDLPLQHVNDGVLERMGRRITRQRIERLIGQVRDAIPGVTLRTTLIAGFPGETEAAFDELLEFVEQARFDRLGCFPYSQEEDTPAADMPDQVPEAVREERCDRVMAAQQRIAFELAAARVGERTQVLMEEGWPDDEALWPARSPREAPDVDPLVYVCGEDVPAAGGFVEVEITGSAGYDCIATPISEVTDEP